MNLQVRSGVLAGWQSTLEAALHDVDAHMTNAVDPFPPPSSDGLVTPLKKLL